LRAVCESDDWIEEGWPRRELIWAYRNGGEDPEFQSFPEQTWLVDHASHEVSPGCLAMAGTGIALLEDAKITAGANLKPALVTDTLNLSGPVGGSGILQRLMNLRMGVALERDTNGSAPHRLTDSLRALERAIGEITGREFALVIKPGREIRLMVQWGDSELYFSELPDGLRSLLNWLAGWVVLQVEHFEASACPLREPVVLMLDEPENHLHPAWQRKVLPAVQRLFPGAQLFVVSHSPFVVSSLNVGWIHKFVRGTDGQVSVEPAVKASEGDSYVNVVGSIMGVTEIYDAETEALLSRYRSLRAQALQRQPGKHEAALDLADTISVRSTELAYMMAKEKVQMEKMLDGTL
jgi:hypothetical protein